MKALNLLALVMWTMKACFLLALVASVRLDDTQMERGILEVEVPATQNNEACLHAAKRLVVRILHEAAGSQRLKSWAFQNKKSKNDDIALRVLQGEGGVVPVGSGKNTSSTAWISYVIEAYIIQLMRRETGVPMLFSGFSAMYGSSPDVLVPLARKRDGYFLFDYSATGKTDKEFTTRFGQLLVEENVTESCPLVGSARERALRTGQDKALGDAIWNVASYRFAMSITSSTVIIALNCPPQFFNETMMFRQELPMLASDRQGTANVALEVYVVTALPRLPEHNRGSSAKRLNANRGPGKDWQANCTGYSEHFKSFGFTGKITCRDCKSDDLAECDEHEPTHLIQRGLPPSTDTMAHM